MSSLAKNLGNSVHPRISAHPHGPKLNKCPGRLIEPRLINLMYLKLAFSLLYVLVSPISAASALEFALVGLLNKGSFIPEHTGKIIIQVSLMDVSIPTLRNVLNEMQVRMTQTDRLTD